MNRNPKSREGPGALELIEQAVHLLRVAPPGTLATYHLGALPFVLGLLYFWADMSRNPFAPQHAVAAALGLGALFLWLKFWQAVFAERLRAHLFGEPPPPLTLARAGRIFHTQAALQPSALFLLPLSLIPALPFAWVYAFYHNVTAQPDLAATPTLRQTIAQAWRMARLWPAQNHALLALLWFFGLFVFIGGCVTAATLPQLLKTLLGIETVFSRGGAAMANTTFFTAMFCVTYLCVDPIVKAVYVLRVFHGESLRSGDDLRVSLRSFSRPAPRLAIFIVAMMLLGGSPAGAQETVSSPASPRSAGALPPQQLDRAISDVIQQRKYTWRMPRERVVKETTEAEPGVIASFFQRVGDLLRQAARAVDTVIETIFQKIFGRLFRPTGPTVSGEGWMMTKQMLLFGLLAVVISALALLLMRFWNKRRRDAGIVPAQAVQPAPDLTDENVAADQLPEDGWTMLARELLGRGEYRLALRAFYLASLAHLAERNLVSLARFKSNHDYELELQRRGHAFPNLRSLFGENVSAFDRVWYGRHEATGELVTQFAANVERIKAGG